MAPSSEAGSGLLERTAASITRRADTARRRHGWVDLAFEVHDRDSEVGGGILSGALAYRLFLWLLPYTLVLVAVLGIAADAADETPEEAADDVGLENFVTATIARSASSSNRWYALVIGVPVLLWLTRSLLRSLIGVHRLVWSDIRERAPKPTLASTVRLLLWLVTALALVPLVRLALPGDLVAVLISGALYAGLWLLLTIYFPHRVTPWTTLIPGALLFGVGAEVIAVVTTYVLGPYASSRESAYGTLGLAAALLLILFFLSRLIVASAVLNATLWQRRDG